MTETSLGWRVTCHCGAIVLMATLPQGLASSASRCDCSFCARRAAAVTAIAASVEILQGGDNLGLYTWGTHTAKHNFCKTCGICTHHQRHSDPKGCGINHSSDRQPD